MKVYLLMRVETGRSREVAKEANAKGYKCYDVTSGGYDLAVEVTVGSIFQAVPAAQELQEIEGVISVTPREAK